VVNHRFGGGAVARQRWAGAGLAGEREAYDRVVDQWVDPRDGISKLGRSPRRGIERADAIYERLLAAEPETAQGRFATVLRTG
jgi:hypothetical protein